MIYQVEFSDDAKKHLIQHLKAGNKQSVKKIEIFANELGEHPRTGTGQPELLKYQNGEFWSRRIDKKHRLIYQVKETILTVIAISAWGHYDDK